MKIAILNYSTGKCHIIERDNDIEDPEEFIVEQGFKLKDIYWMEIKELIIDIKLWNM